MEYLSDPVNTEEGTGALQKDSLVRNGGKFEKETQ